LILGWYQPNGKIRRCPCGPTQASGQDPGHNCPKAVVVGSSFPCAACPNSVTTFPILWFQGCAWQCHHAAGETRMPAVRLHDPWRAALGRLGLTARIMKRIDPLHFLLPLAKGALGNRCAMAMGPRDQPAQGVWSNTPSSPPLPGGEGLSAPVGRGLSGADCVKHQL